MKYAIILAVFLSLLSACNDHSTKDVAHPDTSHQAGRQHAAYTSNHQKNRNAIKETMDKMMHQMHGTKITGNNDIDFAAMMVEHHKGAVEMAKVEIHQGRDPECKAFAQKVIDDQVKEIKFMQAFISGAPKTTSVNAVDFQKALNHSMMVMRNDQTPLYNDIDKDFTAQMIPHHQSAVDMAKAYLAYGQEASLRTLCQNIISTQQKEIHWLKEWLAENKK